VSVTSHELHWSGATGSWESGRRQYTSLYRVWTNSNLDGPQTIVSYFQATGSLPFLGDGYSYGNDADPFAVCNAIDPRREDRHARMWEVAVNFETIDKDDEQGRDNDGNPTNNPLEFHAEIDITKAQFMRPVERAYNLTALPKRPLNTLGPVTNSAGLVLDPPLEKPQTDLVYRIRKYMDHFPESLAREYADAINDASFTLYSHFHQFIASFAKHEARLANLGGAFHARVVNVDGTDELIKYWVNDYEIHSREGGWIEEVVDRGLHAKAELGDPDGRGGVIGFKPDGSAMDILEFAEAFPPGIAKVRRIKDAWGQDVDEPVLLDGDGQPLAPGAPAVYIKYRTLTQKPFNALGISDTLP
jgi:hypothetical protein